MGGPPNWAVSIPREGCGVARPRACMRSRYPYDQVLALVDECEACDVLDVGAGRGALVAELLWRGLRVRACDIAPEQLAVPAVEVARVDLNRDPLPFPDECFDLVTCCEVIEHLENPHALVREFRRVLRWEGRAIVTMPNILNVEARLKAFFSGVSTFHRYLGEGVGRVRAGQGLGHVNPIPLQELLWLGQAYGMPVESIAADYIPAGRRFLVPVAEVIRLFTWAARPRSRSRYSMRLGNSQPVLLGDRLVVSMLKTDETPRVRVVRARRHWRR